MYGDNRRGADARRWGGAHLHLDVRGGTSNKREGAGFLSSVSLSRVPRRRRERTAASGSASASASTPASAPPPSATQRERSAAACTTLRPRMRQSDVNMSSPLSALPRASAAGRARAPGRRRQRSRCPPSPPGRGEHDGRRASRPRQRARARRRAPPPPPLDTAMDSASAAGFKTSVASSSLYKLLRRPRRASQASVRNGGRRALAQTTAQTQGPVFVRWLVSQRTSAAANASSRL